MAEITSEFRFTSTEACEYFNDDRRANRTDVYNSERGARILKDSLYPQETLARLSAECSVEVVADWISRHSRYVNLRDLDMRMALTRANQETIARTQIALLADEFGVRRLDYKWNVEKALAAYQDFQTDLRSHDQTQALPTKWYNMTREHLALRHFDEVSTAILLVERQKRLAEDPQYQEILQQYRELKSPANVLR